MADISVLWCGLPSSILGLVKPKTNCQRQVIAEKLQYAAWCTSQNRPPTKLGRTSKGINQV